MRMNFAGLSSRANTSTHEVVMSLPSLREKTLKGRLEPSVSAAVLLVPSVPSQKSNVEGMDADFEERAAIMEYDGGLSRAEAERLIAEAINHSQQ